MQLQTLNQFQSILILSTLFIVVLVLGEVLHKKLKLKAEYSRKFIHIGVGLICVFSPFRFTNHLYVLVSAILFFAVLVWSRRKKTIGSLHGIQRKSYGELFFPVTIYLWYILFKFYDFQLIFLLPLLLVSISDPAAFFGGAIFNKNKKSMHGTLFFFVSAVIASLTLFFIIDFAPLSHLFGLTFVCAFAGALVESKSLNGWDNLTVPVAIGGILIIYTEIFSQNGNI